MNRADDYKRKEEELENLEENNTEINSTENTAEETTFDKLKKFVKKNKGKVIGSAAILGTAATLALGSLAGQHDIDPDNGKIDIVIPGIEKPIQIPDIGGAIGDAVEDIIGGILPKGPNNPFKPYEPAEHFEKPVIENNEELTGEYLVKKLDLYAWELAHVNYSDTLKEFNYSPESDLSAQFDRISVPTRQYHLDDYESIKEFLYYCYQPSGEDIFPTGNYNAGTFHFDNVYKFNLFYNAVIVDEPKRIGWITVANKEIFEAVADDVNIGGKKIAAISHSQRDKIPYEYGIDYVNTTGEMGYEFFEITREEILNITDTELLQKLNSFIDDMISKTRTLYPEEYYQDYELEIN